MVKIKVMIRAHDGSRKKDALWSCISKAGAYTYKITETWYFFYLITDNTQADLLLTPESKQEFVNAGLEIQTPAEYTASKTVFIKGIDEHISSQSEEILKASIENKHPDMKIERVVKMPSKFNLKLVCNNAKTADAIVERGIQICGQKFTTKKPEKEIFLHDLTKRMFFVIRYAEF